MNLGNSSWPPSVYLVRSGSTDTHVLVDAPNKQMKRHFLGLGSIPLTRKSGRPYKERAKFDRFFILQASHFLLDPIGVLKDRAVASGRNKRLDCFTADVVTDLLGRGLCIRKCATCKTKPNSHASS
jgi:hypothetical protein